MQKCHICSSPPGTWEHGSLSLGSRLRSFHWRSRGLRIATQGRPPRLTCGANRVSLSPLQIMAKQLCGCFSVEWIARCGTTCPARPGASLTSLPAAGTYLRAGYSVVKVKAWFIQTKQSHPGYFEKSRGRLNRRPLDYVESPLPDED